MFIWLGLAIFGAGFFKLVRGSKQFISVGLGVLVLGLAVSQGIIGSGGTGASTLAVASGSNPAGTVTVTSANNCPTSENTAVACRAVDKFASTITYLQGDCNYNAKDGTGFYINDSATTGTGYGATVNVRCGKEYDAYLVSRQLSVNGAGPKTFSATGSQAFVDFATGTATGAQVEARVRDITNDGYLYATLTTQGYHALNRSFNRDRNNATTELTVGTDGFLEFDISFRANTSRRVFGALDGGGASAECGVGINAETSDWQEPDYLSWDGALLTQSKGSLNSEDQLALASLNSYTYEWFYPAPGKVIDNALHNLKFKVRSSAGVNPDDDISIVWACKGLASDQRGVAGAPYKAYFVNNATRDAMVTRTAHLLIDVDPS